MHWASGTSIRCPFDCGSPRRRVDLEHHHVARPLVRHEQEPAVPGQPEVPRPVPAAAHGAPPGQRLTVPGEPGDFARPAVARVHVPATGVEEDLRRRPLGPGGQVVRHRRDGLAHLAGRRRDRRDRDRAGQLVEDQHAPAVRCEHEVPRAAARRQVDRRRRGGRQAAVLRHAVGVQLVGAQVRRHERFAVRREADAVRVRPGLPRLVHASPGVLRDHRCAGRAVRRERADRDRPAAVVGHRRETTVGRDSHVARPLAAGLDLRRLRQSLPLADLERDQPRVRSRPAHGVEHRQRRVRREEPRRPHLPDEPRLAQPAGARVQRRRVDALAAGAHEERQRLRRGRRTGHAGRREQEAGGRRHRRSVRIGGSVLPRVTRGLRCGLRVAPRPGTLERAGAALRGGVSTPPCRAARWPASARWSRSP